MKSLFRQVLDIAGYGRFDVREHPLVLVNLRPSQFQTRDQDPGDTNTKQFIKMIEMAN